LIAVQVAWMALRMFTGSIEEEKKILPADLGNLKKISLELGGKTPMIVFADANLEKAIPAIASGWMLGWDDKWIYMERRFESKDRVIGVVMMRGRLCSTKGIISPNEFVPELGLPEQSPEMPKWLTA
jgi:hypothetical protein